MPNENDVLLALTALQMNFITKDQVIEALMVSTGLKDKSVEEILRERDYLNSRQLKLLTGLVDERLAISDNDPVKTLHSMGISAELHASLISLGNADISKTISEITPTAEPKTRTVIITRGKDDKYTIKHEHARGGIGRIMVAADNDIDREVAMKILISDGFGSSSIGTKEISDRFMEEAKITGRLEHPNIVPVYEIGTTEVEEGTESLYYTMKFIHGKTLSKKIKSYHEAKGKEPLTPLVDAFKDVCQAIGFAHSKGVIHRDLKPENVMVGDYGETLVLDWGLAKARGHEDTRENMLKSQILMFQDEPRQKTMDGFVLGTPAYMPPEQARGNVQEINERSDIYSLGAILYEILTGKPPFDGSNAYEVLGKVINDEPQKPSEVVIRDRVPMELEKICQKCMSKDKEARYKSPSEIVADIENYQEGRSGEAWSYSTAQVVKLWVSRNKLLAAASAAAIFFLVLGAAISLNFGIAARKSEKKALTAEQVAEQQKEAAVAEKERAKAAEKDALAQKKIAESEKERARAAEKDALAQKKIADTERSAAVAREKEALHNMSLWRISMGDRMFLEKRYGKALHYYIASLEAEENETARSSAIVAEQMITYKLKWVTEKKSLFSNKKWIDNGEKILIIGVPCYLLDIKTGEESALAPFLRDKENFVLSPDNKTVFNWDGGGIERWDAKQGKRTGTVSIGSYGHFSKVVIDPAGKYLVVSAFDDGKSHLVVYNADTLEKIRATTEHSREIRELVFSGDGQTLFSGDTNGKIVAWDFTSPKDIRRKTVIETSEGEYEILEIVSDRAGKRIATRSSGGEVKLWDTATGKMFRSFSDEWLQLKGSNILAITPNGETLIRSDYGVYKLTIEDFVSGTHLDTIDTVASDGMMLLSSGGNNPPQNIFLTPDGRFLSTSGYAESRKGMHHRQIAVWEFDSNRAERFPKPGDSVLSLSSSDDGKIVVYTSRNSTRITIWNFETGRKNEWAIPHGKVRRCLTITADKKQVVFALRKEGIETDSIVFLDIETGKITNEIETEYTLFGFLPVTTDSRFLVSTVKYSEQKDGKKARGYGVRAWDIASKREVPGLCKIGNEYGCYSLIPGGNTVLLGASDGPITLWDLETDKSIGEIPGTGSKVERLLSSPDGNRCVAAYRNKTAIVWNITTGARLLHLTLPESDSGRRTLPQCFSGDSKRIVLRNYDYQLVWDIEEKERLGVITSRRSLGDTSLYFLWPFRGGGGMMVDSGDDSFLRLMRSHIGDLDFNIPVEELKRNAERITGIRLRQKPTIHGIRFKAIPADEYNVWYKKQE